MSSTAAPSTDQGAGSSADRSTDQATAADGRAALLRAFAEVAVEKGVRHVGLREVARRAGLSHAAPAHFFGGQEGMLRAFAMEGLELLDETLCDAQEAAAHLPGAERLIADGVACVRFAVDHPAHYDAVFRTGSVAAEPELRELRRIALSGLRTLVEEVLEEGAIAAADPWALTIELWATSHGLASLWADGILADMADGDPEALVEATLRAQVDRLRAAGG